MDRLKSEETRIAMRHGYYNEHCQIQTAAMQAALPLLPSFPESKSLTVIDYGCGQGANSMQPLKQVLSTLPAGATANLIFEDTPLNDFGTLARTVDASLPALAPPGRDLALYPSLVPRGFYHRLLPAPIADLGTAWSCMNYLSVPPAVALDPTAPPAAFVAAKSRAFAAAARVDLLTQLRLRAAEVRPGGYFVAAVGGNASAEEASAGRPTNTGFAPVQVAVMRLAAEGRLGAAELGAFALFPGHERAPAEVAGVLETDEVRALWDVEVFESRLIVHPAWAAYRTALEAAGVGPAGAKARAHALEAYARAVLVNIVSSAGWYWVEVLRKVRGTTWDGADAFLDELTDLAVGEFVEKHADMRVEIWYHYLKLKRKNEN